MNRVSILRIFFMKNLVIIYAIILSFSTYSIDWPICKERVKDFWKGPNKSDVTFVAFGDPQYGATKGDKCGDNNLLMIKAINKLNRKRWPTRFTLNKNDSYYISKVRGVLIAGDLSNNDIGANPSQEQLSFINDYGLCGEKKLKYPVYEGFGNHDFEFN
jgi:hypothetical protein